MQNNIPTTTDIKMISYYQKQLDKYFECAHITSNNMLHYLDAVNKASQLDCKTFRAVTLLRRLPIGEACKLELIKQFANRVTITAGHARYAWHSARMEMERKHF